MATKPVTTTRNNNHKSNGNQRLPIYDVNEVKDLTRGQCIRLLYELGGIDPDLLDGNHHPCPKCQDGTDRFRAYNDVNDTGGTICNVCNPRGSQDIISTLRWFCSWDFGETLRNLANKVGAKEKQREYNSTRNRRKDVDPAEHLEFLNWNELLVSLWCLKKKPIAPAAILAVGGKLARYRKQYTVIALPVWGEDHANPNAKPVGWSLYNITGGTLPRWVKQPDGTTKMEQVKVKLTTGSQHGIIGNLAAIRAATTVGKLEGPSDLLAFLSLPDMPEGTTALTNANGAGERPKPFMLELFRGKHSFTCHDADKPGQAGAVTTTDERNGRDRIGWANAIATVAESSRNVVLPYEIEETHGKDIRDYLNECPENFTYRAIAELVEKAATITPQTEESAENSDLSAIAKFRPTRAVEDDNDPHRLARMNLEQYEKQVRGAIKYWREEWFTWKPARGCYRKITEAELRAKLAQTVKAEFDRLNLIEQAASNKDEPPKTLQVTRPLITNVLTALASMCCVPNSVEPMTFLSDPQRRVRRDIIAMKNGLIDITALLDGKPNEECILPHTPDWFSTIRLPYAFDVQAQCSKWEAFLEKNLEGDHERIAILQEWAGYLLLPDTGKQKFLALEGEGRNGKSVYCAAIAAMLGESNCSHVRLGEFGEKFHRITMFGKLVNIDPDVEELDKVSESYLKALTSGDTIFSDRKGISPLEFIPTARIMLSWNNRPRFRDRSNGLWRRMLLVPWRVEIKDHEVVEDMDKPYFWEQSGELPGIFMWALRGLVRLRNQKRFTTTAIGQEATEDFKADTNSARAFLTEFCEKSTASAIKTESIYQHYVRWCRNNGNSEFSERTFGKEVRRVFPSVEKRRTGDRASRYHSYYGIAFNCSEILGEKVDDTLF